MCYRHDVHMTLTSNQFFTILKSSPNHNRDPDFPVKPCVPCGEKEIPNGKKIQPKSDNSLRLKILQSDL